MRWPWQRKRMKTRNPIEVAVDEHGELLWVRPYPFGSLNKPSSEVVLTRARWRATHRGAMVANHVVYITISSELIRAVSAGLLNGEDDIVYTRLRLRDKQNA